MSLAVYTFYNWFIFIWGSIGMLFIAAVSVREIFAQLRVMRIKGDQPQKTNDSSM